MKEAKIERGLEYNVVDLGHKTIESASVLNRLNELGAKGWQVVHVDSPFFLICRTTSVAVGEEYEVPK